MCVYMSIYIYVHVHIYVYIYIYIYIYIFIYIYIYLYIFIYIYLFIYICKCVCACIHVPIYNMYAKRETDVLVHAYFTSYCTCVWCMSCLAFVRGYGYPKGPYKRASLGPVSKDNDQYRETNFFRGHAA